MAMKVTVEHHLPLGVHVPDQLLRMEDCRMKEPVWLLPFSIEVAAKEGATVVSVDDTIWIEHRDNSYDELLPELVCFLREQILKETIQHM